MRRIGMFLAVALFIAAAWTSTANAALGWFKVNVDVVGMIALDSLTFVEYRLTEVGNSPAFTRKAFITFQSPIKKEVLATALTALATGLPVFVLTDPDDGAFPEVFRLLVASE